MSTTPESGVTGLCSGWMRSTLTVVPFTVYRSDLESARMRQLPRRPARENFGTSSSSSSVPSGNRQQLQPGLHVTFFTPFKNGANEFLWCCLQITLKYVKKIKGATDKNGARNGSCKRSLNGLLALVVKSHRCADLIKMG